MVLRSKGHRDCSIFAREFRWESSEKNDHNGRFIGLEPVDLFDKEPISPTRESG